MDAYEKFLKDVCGPSIELRDYIIDLKRENARFIKAIKNLLEHIDTCHSDDESAQEIYVELLGYLMEEHILIK